MGAKRKKKTIFDVLQGETWSNSREEMLDDIGLTEDDIRDGFAYGNIGVGIIEKDFENDNPEKGG